MDKCSIDKPLTVSVSESDNIDFVKTNSSPGSTWAHLRRNSVSSNSQSAHVSQANSNTPLLASRKLDTSMGSAKKVFIALRTVNLKHDSCISMKQLFKSFYFGHTFFKPLKNKRLRMVYIAQRNFTYTKP